MTLNDQMGGFVHDGPDPSVGIFSDYWYHETCKAIPDDAEVPESILETVSARSIGDGMNHVLAISYLLTCPACDAQWAWIENESDPIYTDGET